MSLEPTDLKIDRWQEHGSVGLIGPVSAVRITHLPTGVVVTEQRHRSLLRNREAALAELERRVALHDVDPRLRVEL